MRKYIPVVAIGAALALSACMPTTEQCATAKGVFAPAKGLVDDVTDFTAEHQRMADAAAAGAKVLVDTLCPPDVLP